MIADELERLAALHRAGDLNDAEYAAAKQAAIAKSESERPDAPSESDVRQELMRLDVQWLKQKSDLWAARWGPSMTHDDARFWYLVLGVPAVIGIVVNIAVFWSLGFIGPAFMSLLPTFMLLVSLAAFYSQMEEYFEAEAEYHRRRNELLEKATPELSEELRDRAMNRKGVSEDLVE
jgi:hypothetical protein